ncbi:MAG: hypothetical protein HYU51_10350 [Candidatus Rokubacteria bacterium]|nr:hypothetical protein [Candidatus Rokubacteria bacterium]
MSVGWPRARGLGGRRGARRDRSFTAVAVAVWIGTLPFVFLLVTPLHGVRAAVITAVAMLIGLVVVCWAIWAWQPPEE